MSACQFSAKLELTIPQSVVCVAAISICKGTGIITYRDFNTDEAKKCRHTPASKGRATS
jgi:GDP-mannose transporter